MAHPALLLYVRDHAPNYTIPTEECTLSTCSVFHQGQLQYDPNLGGNLFFLIIFGSFLLTHILLGLYYRTWGYSIGMVCGLACELSGYVGRIQMHYNPFVQSPFFMYIISLTIAPVFLCASIYICLARLMTVFGAQFSRLRGRKLIITFIASDFTSLLLQAGGGAVAVIADNRTVEYIGIHLMMAGLGLQVLSLTVVLCLAADFALRAWRKRGVLDEKYHALRGSQYFRAFMWALLIATIAILIRSSFRIAELTGGFHGKLWNNEVAFMCLDGSMVTIATILLTVFNYGMVFPGR